METLIHADIFFFIATIGFVLIFALLIVGLIYVIGILRSVKIVSKKIEKDVDSISTEARELFADLRSSMVYRMIFGKTKRLK